MRMNQPAVVMILCHDQESITSVDSRRSGKETVKSLISRCDFVGGADLEDEVEMVLDLTADFLMGGQSLESRCRNGGQSSPSASSKTLL